MLSYKLVVMDDEDDEFPCCDSSSMAVPSSAILDDLSARGFVEDGNGCIHRQHACDSHQFSAGQPQIVRIVLADVSEIKSLDSFFDLVLVVAEVLRSVANLLFATLVEELVIGILKREPNVVGELGNTSLAGICSLDPYRTFRRFE
jgi:hypothetical protein